MMNNLILVFLFMIVFSSIFTITSNNWIASWFGLEINMISFIPLTFMNNNSLTNESLIKYFIIQAIGSSSFLFMNLINSIHMFIFQLNSFSNSSVMLILIPLMLKLGLAPFQFWFISIIEGLNWLNCFLLFSWQKIAPLFLIFYLHSSQYLIFFISILSLIISAMAIYNQTSLRKILAYSSINHLGWMLISMIMSKSMLMIYFLIYSFMLIPLMMIFYQFNINYLNNLINIKSNFIFFSMSISILSLGGLPPLLGFIPKWLIFEFLIYNNSLLILLIMILSNLIIFFIYMHIIFNFFLLHFSFNKWIFYIKIFHPMYMNSIVFLTLCNSLSLFLFNLL